MEKLNNKIQRTQDQKLRSIQPTGVYGYNESDGTYNRAGVSDNGDLHVNIHGTTGGGDMKARTNINDSSTSTFLKCNADGTLEMTAELSTAGLATEAKQDAGNNTLSSIDNKIILPSVLNSDQLKVNDSAVVGSLAVLNNNLTTGVPVMGNTEADGSGTSEHLHTDGNGNLNVQVISSVNTVPANSVNSGITDDPANSMAVGLRGRTTITDASTETFLKCDANGVLEVSGGGGGGGDATAANQVTINNSIGDTNSKIDAMRASDSLTTVKAEITSLRTDTTDGSAKCKIMALNGGGQFQVLCDSSGNLNVNDLGATDRNNKLDALRLNSQLNDVKSIATSTLGVLGDGTNLYIDTDGYSKLQINVITATGTGSPTMSIEWSDSSSFGAGDVFVCNGTTGSSVVTTAVSFSASVRVDSSTLTTQASAFYEVLPARYARITVFQTSGGAISYEAKSYLSH